VKAPALAALTARLDAVPGTVSVWCGRLGGPASFARDEDATHYAASTMKVAVLAALYRAAGAGTLDLSAEVPVRNEFASAAAPGSFACTPGYDSDTEVWQRIGGTATPRWLARRMIVVSGNLATNLCLCLVGREAVEEVWRLVGARHSMVGRCIEDHAAADRGITNLVTAADLAALMSAIALGAEPGASALGAEPGTSAPAGLADPRACRGMLDVLLAQERGEDLASGLPPGTRIAHKNGWVTGVRHGAAVVFPPDADPYVLVCCTTTTLARTEAGEDEACALLAEIAAASWADRHRL
jgi:beta-lactamase class A